MDDRVGLISLPRMGNTGSNPVLCTPFFKDLKLYRLLVNYHYKKRGLKRMARLPVGFASGPTRGFAGETALPLLPSAGAKPTPRPRNATNTG